MSAVSAASVPAKTTAPKDACSDKKSKFAHDQCESFIHSAPGDEYFGRLKLSYLGINNTFHDEAIRAGAYTTDSNIINKVNFADEALRAWASRYPGDPQLARSYFLAIKMYKKIYTKDAQDKAWNYMNVLVHQFPNTYFGKLEKKDLAIGFTEHYFANAQLCPTPLPSGATLANTSPVPSPQPTPTAKPGAPKVQIIDPPCVKPSPAPTPTAAPSNFPSPAATHKPNS
ncbi:MAG TPA: hypothetical protein VFN49_01275 [Candidatus Aquilonibacter sp.]|nr:hypothetical protein [Candidatus Aquilonibacter sp.]